MKLLSWDLRNISKHCLGLAGCKCNACRTIIKKSSEITDNFLYTYHYSINKLVLKLMSHGILHYFSSAIKKLWKNFSMQFRWQLEASNSCFSLVNILWRKFDISSQKKEMKMIEILNFMMKNNNDKKNAKKVYESITNIF